MYVVKVGKMYVKDFDNEYGTTNITEIELSKEVMRGFTKGVAELIAGQCRGIVIEMDNVTTNE